MIRAIGRLGRDDQDAAQAIRGILADRSEKEDDDVRSIAALAAGQIRDPSLIPALRPHLDSPYEPLRQNAALSLGLLGDRRVAVTVRPWLSMTSDENDRGVAAEVLGNLHDQESLAALRAALAVEPFPWVRAKMEDAIQANEAAGNAAPVGKPGN